MHRQNVFTIVCLGLSLALASCDGTIDPAEPSNFVLSARAAGGIQKPSAQSLELSSVKVLLKSIRVHSKRFEGKADILQSPVVLVLSLSGARTSLALSTIAEGIYDRVRFRLHKAGVAEPIPDPEFLSGASGDHRYSVIVNGMWNGMPFTFRSQQNADQEYELQPAARVASGTTTEVTLLVDPYSWFEGPAGPLGPNRAENISLIDSRIKQSFCRTGESAES